MSRRYWRIAALCTLGLGVGCSPPSQPTVPQLGDAGMPTAAIDAHDPHAHGDAHHGDAHEAHAHTAQPADAAVSGLSLYQLEGKFTDQRGEAVGLDVFAGHPVLVVMFYAGCESACPTLVHDVQRVEAALPAADRDRVRVLLVTFDPERDTPERLERYAEERKISTDRWRLLSGDTAQIRELAAVLGVRYRALPSGDFSHSMLISLLAPTGEVVDRIEGLNQPVDELAKRVSESLRG